MFPRSPLSGIGYLILLTLLVIVIIGFQKIKVNSHIRAWGGVFFMYMTLAVNIFNSPIETNWFWLSLWVVAALIFIPVMTMITFKSKEGLLEVWITLLMGMPIVRYCVGVAANHMDNPLYVAIGTIGQLFGMLFH